MATQTPPIVPSRIGNNKKDALDIVQYLGHLLYSNNIKLPKKSSISSDFAITIISTLLPLPPNLGCVDKTDEKKLYPFRNN